MKTSARFATGPPTRLRLSRQLGNYFQRATAFTLAGFLLGVNQASAQPTNLVVTTRHAPSLNGSGRIEGSLQQLLGESIALNGGFIMTGDLLVAGTPTLRLNGNPSFGGTIIGNGSALPSGYPVTLNGNCAVYHLRTRTIPVALPTVTAPPQPAGARTVTINSAGQSIGDPATLRHLTLNGNVGLVPVPPGAYGNFTANGGSGFVLGTVGSTTPLVYHLQYLSLNGNCQLSVAGPVILTVANGISANGSVGATNKSAWLQLQVASGGVTLNGGCTIHGNVTAPAGTVTVNGNSRLVGGVQCDRLVVNSGGLIEPGTTVNESPAATAQSLSVSEDGSLPVALTGSDPEGGALTFSVLSQPTHGTLEGTVPNLVYVPSTDFSGDDGFTFKVNDGQADSATATISINVTAVNDAPVAQAQTQATPEDMPLEITLTGTDVDSESLTYAVATPPAHGSLAGTAPNVIYTPESDYFGGDHFQFSVGDGQLTRTNTVTINVTPLDDRPSAIAQQVTVNEDTSVAITLMGADAEGSQLAFFVATQPQHGTLAGIAPVLTYTSATNYHGADNFQFTTSDGTLTSTVATVSLVINPINDPPTVQSQTVIVPEDVATNLVLAASDVEADLLQFVLLSSPADGTLNGTAPSLVFSPAADFHGTNTFLFSANDGQATSAPVAITLIVTPVNDPPVAAAQSLFLEEDSVLAIMLGGADVDGDPLTFVVVTQPTNGTLSGTSPNLTYTPITNFTGADSFTFEASDGQTHSTPATVSLTLLPVNDAPVAEDQALTTEEDTPLNLTLAGGDPENDALEFAVLTSPAHGTLIGTPPHLTYTPSANFHGMDAFTFFADDGQTNSAPATVVLTINPVNDAPVAVPQSITTLEDTLVPINLSGADPDGDALTYQVVSGPMHGTLNGVAPSLTYQPLPGYSGPDAFTFNANDGQLNSNTGTVVIVVLPVNDTPIVNAGDDQFTSVPTNAVTLEGALWDDDFFGTNSLVATWSQVAGPGIVSFAESNAPTTTATFSTPGVYALRLMADDGLLATSDDMTVTINAAPAVSAGPDLHATVGEIVVLLGTVSDDGLPASNSVVVAWELVTATGFFTLDSPTNVVTTAQFGEIGTYIMRLTASDTLATNSDEVIVTVSSANQAPVVTTGPRQLIMLPAAANLTASVTDDGLSGAGASTIVWSKFSGPGSVAFANPATANTTATFSEAGDYVLRLAADDSALTGFADLRVAVRTPAMNEPPIVSAGQDMVIGLTNVATLNGFAQDDGLPQSAGLAATWGLVSGPGSVMFENQSRTNARATFSTVGTYVLRLTVSDSQFTAADEVNVTVYPFNQPPLADAGPDQTITIPNPSALVPSGATPLDASVDFANALVHLPHWENAIGQPGLDGWLLRNSVAVGDDLFITGYFQHAGGKEAHGSARWNGSEWFPLYDPRPHLNDNYDPAITNIGYFVYDCGGFEFCNQTLDCVAARGPEAFVGGLGKNLAYSDGYKDMTARWSGTGWESWVFKHAGNQVRVIRATPYKIYFGGYFALQPTNATDQVITNLPWSYGVATWDGNNWGTLGSGIVDIRDTPQASGPNNYHAYVMSMAVATNGNVFVAGLFQMATATGNATNIAMWNNSLAQWESLDGGIVNDLRDLNGNENLYGSGMAIAENGDLYVGGTFQYAGRIPARNLARWDGLRWWPVAAGTNEGVNGSIEAMAVRGRDLYAGGNFSEIGGIKAFGVAKYDGQFWRSLGQGTSFGSSNGVAGQVFSLAADETGVYVGGIFTAAGGQPANNIAKWEFPVAPAQVAYLHGTVTDDSLPPATALTTVWTKASGPGAVTFANGNSPVTTAAFSEPGNYVLQLSANDSEFTILDQVTITVQVNQPPAVSAGTNQIVTMGESANLSGTVTDDGWPAFADVAKAWSVVAGPGRVEFENAGETQTTARFNLPGNYVLRLAANDSQFTAYDDITVTVLPPNAAPAVQAVSWRFFSFCLCSFWYDGEGETVMPTPLSLGGFIGDDIHPSGILTQSWSQVSGPGQALFEDAASAYTSVVFSEAGTYVLRLTVSDSELSSTSEITVQVFEGGQFNRPPHVWAGNDLRVTLPSAINVAAQVFDDGPGTNLTFNWRGANGPGPVTFGDASSTATTASFNRPGTYELALDVSDGTYTISDTLLPDHRRRGCCFHRSRWTALPLTTACRSAAC